MSGTLECCIGCNVFFPFRACAEKIVRKHGGVRGQFCLGYTASLQTSRATESLSYKTKVQGGKKIKSRKGQLGFMLLTFEGQCWKCHYVCTQCTAYCFVGV